MATILFFPSVQAILFFPSAVFEGTPSNINKYIMNNLYTKNGAFIRLVTKILQSHLTNINSWLHISLVYTDIPLVHGMCQS